MDNNIAKSILLSYEIIEVDEDNSKDGIIVFSIHGKRFALWCPDAGSLASEALIFVLDDTTFDYPHIMLSDYPVRESAILPVGVYRYVCLHESGSIVQALMSYEEKIIDSIERLIELLSLTALKKEKEFQKEFLFYWNSVAEPGIREVYLDNNTGISFLHVYQNGNEYRYLADSIFINDLEHRDNGERRWKERVDIESIHVPIIDNRGILPPTKTHLWGKSEIIDILFGDRITHISDATYEWLSTETTKYDILDIVFTMTVNSLPITFTACLKLKGGNHNSILERIKNNTVEVNALYCQRKDYSYLHQVIGNSIENRRKRALLIGAGSLGSYFASELVKNGFSNLTIYDGDSLSQENFMRWYYSGMISSVNKAKLLKFYLEQMHPEIAVTAVDKNIDCDTIVKEAAEADYIIFTVGSSDVQLTLNRALKKAKCNATVIFAWIEAGGQNSHILKVDYSQKGCFECLFTGPNGTLINNKANITVESELESKIIRNGCGGTRAAYGTSVLLRTTSALLDVFRRLDTDSSKNNFLVNISSENTQYDESAFVEKGCFCCGN